jgi:SNF2 family DNA or RNA helicase
MTDILYDWLDREGILPKSAVGYIKGGTKAADFERVRQGFQDYTWGQTGNLQCVLMTTAGNYGLDLYNARYVICFDELFNPQKMEQVLSRGHRSGNTTGVTAITMTTVNSYEEKKRDILERKREVFNAIVDESDEAFAKLFTLKELIELI